MFLFIIIPTVILFIALLRHAIHKANEREAERQKNRDILEKVEKPPTLLPVCTDTSFQNEEEQALNLDFRCFLESRNEQTLLDAHLLFLQEKKHAYLALGMEEDVGRTDAAISETREKLRKAKKVITYSSAYVRELSKLADFSCFSDIVEKFPKPKDKLMRDFFETPYSKVLEMGKIRLIFTPGYLIVFTDTEQMLRLMSYSMLSVKHTITTEIVTDWTRYVDDVVSTWWKYETKDGEPDRRYRDNPHYAEVYRGSVELGYSNGKPVVFSFTSKSSALRYESYIENLNRLLMTRYAPAVQAILERNEAVKTAGGIAPYLEQIAKEEEEKRQEEEKKRKEEERRRQEQEKAEADARAEQKKREAEERKKREAEERAKQAAERAERARLAQEQEKARQLEKLRRSLKVKDGVLESWTGTDRSLAVPKDTAAVIGRAFSLNSFLEEIRLPAGVTDIQAQAFWQDTALKKVTFPATLERIGQAAFEGCTALKSITLPNKLETLEEHTFFRCSSLEKLRIPEGVQSIGKEALAECRSLREVVIPSGVSSIAVGAFKNCSSLRQIVLPDTVTAIGAEAFFGCEKLESVVFGNGLHTIGDCAFVGCLALTRADLPESLKEIGAGAFAGCKKLDTVTGADSLAWGGKGVFVQTPWLRSIAREGVVIAEGCLEVYTGTETEFSIPQGVTSIAQSAFEGNSTLSSVLIPEGVTRIEDLAFARCPKLSMVQIPDSVIQIGANAFAGDKQLTIRCFRGSAASAFRIQHKIPGNYLPRERTAGSGTTDAPARRGRSRRADGLSGLSDEERRLIMDMRREKLEQKEAQTKPAAPQPRAYTTVAYDETRAVLRLRPDNRTITNNIFSLKFEQESPAGTAACDYEAFVVDPLGQPISNVQEIHADPADPEKRIQRFSFTLSSQSGFDKNAAYPVILRYKGADGECVSQTPYTIRIDFAADFDF